MDLTRRAVLIAGLAATAAGVGAAHTGKLPPPPPLDGELRFDEASRAAAADDFGHLAHRTPEGVLLPGSAQDVATTIRWAGGLGRQVAPQGQSHSVYGRSQVRAGIVMDMTRLRTVHSVQNDRVVVDAGATWSEVLAATLPQGLTPPVLTGYLALSVGGTLVVGGIGDTTSRYGMQSDNVLELRPSPAGASRSPVRRTATPTCSTRCVRASDRWRSSPERHSRSFRRRSRYAGTC